MFNFTFHKKSEMRFYFTVDCNQPISGSFYFISGKVKFMRKQACKVYFRSARWCNGSFFIKEQYSKTTEQSRKMKIATCSATEQIYKMTKQHYKLKIIG
jgi:hypothetical protein